jgi:hypothetical protein
MRKYILGALFLGFAAILVVGGVNRTLAKTGAPLIGVSANGATSGRGAGRVGQPDLKTTGDETPLQESNPPIDANTLEGFISQITSNGIEFTSTSGETMDIAGRGWRYAQDAGFQAQKGDRLRLSAFTDTNGRLEILSIENLDNQMQVALRGVDGRPMWGGGGGGGSQP